MFILTLNVQFFMSLVKTYQLSVMQPYVYKKMKSISKCTNTRLQGYDIKHQYKIKYKTNSTRYYR